MALSAERKEPSADTLKRGDSPELRAKQKGAEGMAHGASGASRWQVAAGSS